MLECVKQNNERIVDASNYDDREAGGLAYLVSIKGYVFRLIFSQDSAGNLSPEVARIFFENKGEIEPIISCRVLRMRQEIALVDRGLRVYRLFQLSRG